MPNCLELCAAHARIVVLCTAVTCVQLYLTGALYVLCECVPLKFGRAPQLQTVRRRAALSSLISPSTGTRFLTPPLPLPSKHRHSHSSGPALRHCLPPSPPVHPASVP